jgi:hypothetical protein
MILTPEQIEQIKKDVIERYGPPDELIPIGEFIGFLQKYIKNK